MSKDHAARDAVHEATHQLPGIPQHQDYPEGHQGTTRHGQSVHNRPLPEPGGSGGGGSHHGSARAHDRPPRVLTGWQNWIAGLFSRKTD